MGDIFNTPSDGGLAIADLRKIVKERWGINPQHSNGGMKPRKQLRQEVERRMALTGKISVNSFPMNKLTQLVNSFKSVKKETNAKHIYWTQHRERGDHVSGEISFLGSSKEDLPNIRNALKARLKALPQEEDVAGKLSVSMFPRSKIGELIYSLKFIKQRTNAKYIRWDEDKGNDKGNGKGNDKDMLVSGELTFLATSHDDLSDIRSAIQDQLTSLAQKWRKELSETQDKTFLWTKHGIFTKEAGNVQKDLLDLGEALSEHNGITTPIEIQLDLKRDYPGAFKPARITIISENQTLREALSQVIKTYFREQRQSDLFDFEPDTIYWGCKNPKYQGSFTEECALTDSSGRCLNKIGRDRYIQYKDACKEVDEATLTEKQQYNKHLNCYKARTDFEETCSGRIDKAHRAAREFPRLKALRLAESLGIAPDPVLLDMENSERLEAPCFEPWAKNSLTEKCSKEESDGRCKNEYAHKLVREFREQCPSGLDKMNIKRQCLTNPKAAQDVDMTTCKTAQEFYQNECYTQSNDEPWNEDVDKVIELCPKYHLAAALLPELQRRLHSLTRISADQRRVLGELLVIYLVDYEYDIQRVIKLVNRAYIIEFGKSLNKANLNEVEKILKELISHMYHR